MNQATILMIKASGRSWWQARYSDGKILSEWDTGISILDKSTLPTLVNSRTSRWEEAPKDHMVGLRLLCPNGNRVEVGELEAPEGHRFFQLKLGAVDVQMGYGGAINGIRRHQEAHIIGVVADIIGNCVCRAWETVVEVDERGKTTQTIPPGTRYLVDGTKNWQRVNGRDPLLGKTIHIQGQFKYQERLIWGCSGDRLTIAPAPRPAWNTYLPNNQEYQISSLHKRLIEFADNIFDMKYRNIGKLNLDVQQLKV